MTHVSLGWAAPGAFRRPKMRAFPGSSTSSFQRPEAEGFSSPALPKYSTGQAKGIDRAEQDPLIIVGLDVLQGSVCFWIEAYKRPSWRLGPIFPSILYSRLTPSLGYDAFDREELDCDGQVERTLWVATNNFWCS